MNNRDMSVIAKGRLPENKLNEDFIKCANIIRTKKKWNN